MMIFTMMIFSKKPLSKDRDNCLPTVTNKGTVKL